MSREAGKAGCPQAGKGPVVTDAITTGDPLLYTYPKGGNGSQEGHANFKHSSPVEDYKWTDMPLLREVTNTKIKQKAMNINQPF